MEENPKEVEVIHFESFTVDLTNRTLFKNGNRIRIEPKPFQALELLLHNTEAVVTFDAFAKVLWPGIFVDFRSNLNTQINKLRTALGQSQDKPYVLTQPGIGYCRNREIPVIRD